MATTPSLGFRITGGKGFHMTFANGYTVSVQFGWGNYCNDRDIQPTFDTESGWAHEVIEWDREKGARGDATAEVAVWGPDGELVDWGCDTVLGWQTPDQVAAIIAKYSTL